MTAFEQAIGTLLLFIWPTPIGWAILFLVLFAIMLAALKVPGTVAAQYSFLVVWVLSEYLGGIFILMQIFLIIGMAASLIFGIFKGGNR